MKKSMKLIPFALAALMLVGCASKPIGPSNGKDPMIGTEGMSYQEFYDKLYSENNGNEQAAKDLIFAVAKDVVSKSTNFAEYVGEDGKKGYESLVNDRKNEVLDAFYTSNYKKNSLFDEQLLIDDLTNKGYKITPKDESDKTPYEESYEEGSNKLLAYEKLHTKLKYDYSDYLKRNSEYDIYLQLLKEEYIMSQKKDYFNDKRIRKVQYFKYSPASSSEAEKIQTSIEESLEGKEKITEAEFKTLAQTTFQQSFTKFGLDKAAKDYAIINEKDANYKPLFVNGEINKDLTEKEKEERISAYNSYTNNGAYTKENGYLLKQIDVLNVLGYGEGFISSDDNSTTIVDAEIDSLIKKAKLEEHLIGETNLLDYTGSGSKVFKKESNYYVVRVEVVNGETKGLDYLKGARALTKNTTNVKNAVSHYLEEKEVNVYEETLFNYLKDTFGFSK